jgi:Response regulator of the LytR/AlgR family
MFRIAVCDDEKFFISELTGILEEYLKSRGIAHEMEVFDSGEKLIESGERISRYNIIFLDISMKDMDGMAAARKVREISKDVYIVFVTAFANFMADGYKVDAVRYILKNAGSLTEAVHECMDAIQEKMNYRVIWKGFHFIEGYRRLSLDRLLYIESRSHKLEFYVLEDELVKYTLYQTLNTLENEISEYDFLRIHQSYLVNMRYIRNLKRYCVLLHNGRELEIPKARYKYVEEAFISYRGEM